MKPLQRALGLRFALACVIAVASAAPANACRIEAALNLDDIAFADLVVEGRIANYRIVPDEEARQARQKRLATSDLSPVARKLLEDQTSFLGDYAAFDIIVDQVLAGHARGRLSVTWDNSTFEEPAKLAPGRYLIALRGDQPRRPQRREGGGAIAPDPRLDSFRVLQAACAPAFIFEDGSVEAARVRTRLLERKN